MFLDGGFPLFSILYTPWRRVWSWLTFSSSTSVPSMVRWDNSIHFTGLLSFFTKHTFPASVPLIMFFLLLKCSPLGLSMSGSHSSDCNTQVPICWWHRTGGYLSTSAATITICFLPGIFTVLNTGTWLDHSLQEPRATYLAFKDLETKSALRSSCYQHPWLSPPAPSSYLLPGIRFQQYWMKAQSLKFSKEENKWTKQPSSQAQQDGALSETGSLKTLACIVNTAVCLVRFWRHCMEGPTFRAHHNIPGQVRCVPQRMQFGSVLIGLVV